MNLHLSILDQSPIISGHTPERLLQLREQFDADELMIPTITGHYASRLRSYELLALKFGLQCEHRAT